jgi:uncharacterized membrane protein
VFEVRDQDFQSLKDAEGDDLSVEGAVVMSRDADGNVDVLEAGAANTDTSTGAVISGGIGVVVDLFAPPLLAATAVGIGALLGHLSKKHEEKELGVELDEYSPPDSSAVVVVIENKYLDRVGAALDNSTERINKAISQDDYDKLADAVSKSQDEIGKDVDSQTNRLRCRPGGRPHEIRVAGCRRTTVGTPRQSRPGSEIRSEAERW